MDSTLRVGNCHSVREKQKYAHGRGQGRVKQEKFNGIAASDVLKLGKKQPQQLTRKERVALELYWDARLAAMGEVFDRGRANWLTFEADIGVRDAFDPDSVFFIPGNGERQEGDGWVTVV